MMLATGVLALVVLVGLLALWAWRYTKAGPNEVLIISGRKRKVIDPDGRKRVVGYRLVRGGAFVWPILERVQRLSLELLTIEVQTADAYTARKMGKPHPASRKGVLVVFNPKDAYGLGRAA